MGEPADNKRVTKASNLKVGQLVFVKGHQKGTFDPSYVFDHRVAYSPAWMERRRDVISITSSQ